MGALGDSILLWLGAYALHSTLFLACVWLIERLWKRATPALMSALWRTALLAGIATATLQAAGLASPVAGRLAILPPVAAAEPVIARATTPAPIATPDLSQPAPVASEIIASEITAVETAAPETATITPTDAPVVSTGNGFSFDVSIDWSLIGTIALFIWAAIVALLALRAAIMWFAAHRELRDRQPVVHGPLFERIQALASDIGLRRLPQVSFSDRIAGPFTLPSGEICVPVWARERLPQNQLDAMLAHEMAHVLHRDSLWLAIGMGVSTVFFFQPLNLLARRRLANLAELAADDWAATRAGSGRPLAECISTFVNIAHARSKAIATPEFAAAMAKSKSELVQRVERLINNRYTTGVLPMKTKLLIGGCALAFAAVMPGLAAQAHDQPTPFPLALEPVEAPEPPAAPEAPAAPEEPTAPAELEGAAALDPAPPPEAPAVPAEPAAVAAPEAVAAPAAIAAPEAPAVPAAIDPAPAPAPAPAPQTQRSVTSNRSLFGGIDMTISVHKPMHFQLEAKAKGDIDLAPDGSGVASLSNGGFLDATLDKNGVSRRVRYSRGDPAELVQRIADLERRYGPNHPEMVRAKEDLAAYSPGGIKREFWVGRKIQPWGTQADAFVAELMPILFRETGLNANERVDWFLKQRGQDALFAEISLIDSDSIQTAYVSRWLGTTTLAAPMFERVVALAGDQIDSDSHLQATLDKAYNTQHPKGRQLVQLLKAAQSIDSDSHAFAVLTEVASDAMAAEDTANAYFDLARTIDSDSHMQAAFSKIVGSPTISDARVGEIIRLAGEDIDSDSHVHAVLRGAARRVGASDALARDYLGAVRSIDSDSHNMDALQILAREARLSPASWRSLLEEAFDIGSDSHKAALLVGIAPRVAASDDLSRAYISAARTIGSDSHAMQALQALSKEPGLSTATWRNLLDASTSIGSDSHKSALLVSVANRFPPQPDLVSAYNSATRTIGSDSHRHQAEEAMR